MRIWAHSLIDRVETDWEPLQDHLKRVGDHCAKLAEKFGALDVARAAGLLHDVGKVKPAFQAYLKGGPQEPHSAEGAKAACAHFPGPIGRILAFAIAGHHAGLANGIRDGSGLSSLEERLKTAEDLSDFAGSLALPDARPLPGPLRTKRDAFAVQFFIRMLFSCLVDADRLETEAFHAESSGEAPDRGWPGSLEILKTRLDAHLADFDPDRSLVARKRAEVLVACRQAAAQPPGLFSLTVPTGGGKTLSSLAFALDHAVTHGFDRVVYVIPFTSIIDQTAAVFREVLQDDDAVLEHHSAFDWERAAEDDEGRDGLAKLRRAAENWDRPVVVTTAVQFFESLFSNKPGRCRKLHNLARAVIVLDEAQTLPLKLLRPCLAACGELQRGYGSSVVFCTATQPAVREEDGFTAPERLTGVTEIAPDPRGLYRALKRVRVRHAGRMTDGELAEAVAAEPQALVIVNTRRHARDLAEALAAAELPGARLLTTALTPVDRRAILEAVRADLKGGRPVRLVATSLIEAGVDVDFPAVWRASAGIDSLAQAAGRCNREGRQGPEGGRVTVFEPEEGQHRRPPPELKQFAEVAASVLRRHDDPLSLEAIAGYFGELYWRRGEGELDAAEVGAVSGVMHALQDSHALKPSCIRLDYPFADIAAAFRLIDDAQMPVIVPESPRAPRNAPANLIDGLKHAERLGGLARRLQPFIVQVPQRAHRALRQAGVIEAVRPDRFGEQFLLLADPARYSPQRGLDWVVPELRDIESDIF